MIEQESASSTDPAHLLSVRVTAILVNDRAEILLVRQHVDATRGWSLPGGRLERGESIGLAIAREVEEETGILAEPVRLLYVADLPDADPPVVHMTFQMRQTGGRLRLPSNEHDENPIHDVRFVPVAELPSLGFTDRFIALAMAGFPDAGRYVGLKANIGL